MIRYLILFSILFAGSSYSIAQKANRVEELMIWKISEELKLSVKEEKDLSALIKSLDEEKSASSEKIDSLIQQLATEKEEKIPKLMSQYRAALNKYNSISIDEFNKIQKILPKNKAAKYFVIKADLTKKIRNLLALGDRPRDRVHEKPKLEKQAPLADPKIIEE